MEIRVFDNTVVPPVMVPAWDAFVKSHPRGSIFQRHSFYSLCLLTPGYRPVVAIARGDSGQVNGVMQGIIMSEGTRAFRAFTSRAISWGGPLAHEETTAVRLLEEYERHLGRKVIYSQLRPVGPPPDKRLFARAGYTVEPHLDIFNDLAGGETAMLEAVHKERRRNIGRAGAKGVTVRITSDMKDIEYSVSLILKLYRRIGLPSPPEALLTNAQQMLGDDLKVFVAEYQGRIIGARMVLCSADMIYDWYAGSDPEYHNKYVNDILPWEVMLWGSRNKFRIFDFGGAGAPDEKYGVRDFKLRYGGTLTETFRFTRVHKPLLMFIGSRGINAYKFIKKLFR